MAPKVLFVLTSHNKMGDTGNPTGWYLPEFAHPYEELKDHAEITIASPKGGAAPLDPSSVEASKDDKVSTQFLKEKESLWKNTEKLSDFLGKAKEFEAIFFVGGHGPMFDLATDETSHKLINEFYSNNKVVAAVCHGPAALTHVKIPGGGYLLDGQAVTGFSNSEEDAVGLTSAMPFKLEDKLNEATGGKYEKAAQDWGAKVVVARDGKLITGQNPASAGPVGQAILKAIS
ncbi:Class I glutamine amidotransferase-like protein [Glarea lozoyensis ATCC 20868]|uniref:D-lactate dehydratase n=2 Tax=Glarea lozoyensis TaxID=101852 RepID=S3D543_GLAL2|nr:Class I glutamine amidotransferase-like protein [Glarea lozoyensis ATCC 20868]EHK97030.1 putative chaperone protein HSP31 [Glarea lozoyensis 74030]EPE32209.1 Class I glutamine amidotransferase-like protein [Glarea lozoyensis ATCC 20868]